MESKQKNTDYSISVIYNTGGKQAGKSFYL